MAGLRQDWLAPNMIDEDASHLSVTRCVRSLNSQSGLRHRLDDAANQRARGGLLRASKITIHQCSTFRRGRIASGRANRFPPSRLGLATIRTEAVMRSAPLACILAIARASASSRT
ncbi:blr1868 [Bradyrhizobium diazoefficiens USDA 110]|uniref:Blr1868 protein n=3 Tax=Bradyrhizobium TaxID=374 RepID=H7C6P2_BRADU|nr:ID338 [Bradyrhizobium japonicum]AND87463.1 hypothetical protein AAV28_06270 [Bradyrhizobium diazoefficiens USDA 110]APO50486.1 hypothetical protein BD122_09570 [Bradyrhizobium diazoefficiens]AWL91547.1 hypothetical protein CIT37_04225 [Bradyrhizobium ottawaense]AJA65535.1 hypothetical protein RN69_38650 [Bradyrhizobium japonicum]